MQVSEFGEVVLGLYCAVDVLYSCVVGNHFFEESAKEIREHYGYLV